MPTPSYTSRFGGSTIYPANPTFTSITTAVDITLAWPIEQATAGDLIVAEIIEVNTTASGVDITLADATQMSQGYTALFNNIGANTFTVKDQGGNTLLSVASGLVWQLYLADNSTANGVWRVFQYGAGASSANAAALAGAGLKAITTTLNQKATLNAKSSNYVLVDADRAQAFLWTGGSGTITLPDPTVVGNDWFVFIRNGGTGNLSVVASSGTIDGAANKLFLQTNSAIVISDGTNFYTIGFGQSINTVFDFITIDVAGTGDYTLSGGELNRVSYRFTGLLTGNRNIIVPTTIQQYWVDNSTTGAFTLTVKTPLGTGVVVPQSARTILYCDGTNVVNAETVVASVPVTIAQGGTSAITAAGARTNLDVPQTATVVPITRVLTAGQGLTGGGDLSADRSFDIGAGSGILVNANDVALDTTSFRNVDHSAVTMNAGAGLTGGGDISANRTFNVGAGTGISVNTDDVALDTGSTRNVDHTAVTITGANSLTGGGDISANRTLELVNDAASPGNLYYYGTDAAGVKGFFPIPNAAARTWQNVAGSRALNTDYTNSTGGEIEVNFSGVCDSGNAQTMLVDGITVGGSGQNTSTGSMSISATVPNGSVYRVNGSAAGGSFTWAELRP